MSLDPYLLTPKKRQILYYDFTILDYSCFLQNIPGTIPKVKKKKIHKKCDLKIKLKYKNFKIIKNASSNHILYNFSTI